MAALGMTSMATLPQQFGKASISQRLSVQNGTAAHLSMKSKGTYNFEVTVGQNEVGDSAIRRFRRAVNTSGVIMEVKRRRNFENTQDKLKRKVKELRLKKSKKFQRPPTWEETNSTVDPAPFADMFGEPDDIFAEQ